VGTGPGVGRDQAAEAVALSPEPLEPLGESPEPLDGPLESLESLESLDELEPLELSEESDPESFVEPASVEPESDFTVEPASALRPLAAEPWSFL
jgi:hypothetical protein